MNRRQTKKMMNQKLVSVNKRLKIAEDLVSIANKRAYEAQKEYGKRLKSSVQSYLEPPTMEVVSVRINVSLARTNKEREVLCREAVRSIYAQAGWR